MLKILQDRLQQYMNHELPVVQAGFRKGRGTRDLVNIHWIVEKAREFQKNIYFCFIDYAKATDCADHNRLEKFLKRWECLKRPDHLTCLLTNVYQVKNQLELDMEQQTGSKLGKEYVKAVYCHPAYLTCAEYIMRNAGLDEAQSGIKIAASNINNLRYADNKHHIYWRSKWQPTPVLLPGKSRGQKSLVQSMGLQRVGHS